MSGEHLLVMPVPLALETLFGIIVSLAAQKLLKLRITGLHLLSRSVPVIGEIVTSAPPDAHVDQPPERIRRMLQPFGAVLRVQIKDDAGVLVFGPWQITLVVLFDQADGAIDQVHAVAA